MYVYTLNRPYRTGLGSVCVVCLLKRSVRVFNNINNNNTYFFKKCVRANAATVHSECESCRGVLMRARNDRSARARGRRHHIRQGTLPKTKRQWSPPRHSPRIRLDEKGLTAEWRGQVPELFPVLGGVHTRSLLKKSTAGSE